MAYSGGRDSTALLHATLVAAAGSGARVLALHVHHGLSPHADAWVAHCEAQCARWRRRGWRVDFVVHRVSMRPPPGESVEAWARTARYSALRAMAIEHGATLVLLAHHQRDQAETLLLQALRGAGTAGLSGMPELAQRDGIAWQRPWLRRSRAEIEAYVRRHRLRYIDDDSNADTRYARNRLRLQVWPALSDAFPNAETSLAASARWAQEADAALRELAALDLAQAADASGLHVKAWRALSAARRSNALRAWLAAALGAAVPASLSERLLDELMRLRAGRWPAGHVELRLYRGLLTCEALAATTPRSREVALCVTGEGIYPLPGWGGALQVESVSEHGVPLAWLAQIELRVRVGGEQFQAGIGRPARSLKKQFQAAGVPAWQRAGPLVYSGGQLVFVPGLGLDARVIGLPGQPQVRLHWAADAAGSMLRRHS